MNTDSNGFEDVVPRIAGGIDLGNDADVRRYETLEGVLGCHSFENYARTAIMAIGKGYFNENRPSK